MTEPNFEIVNKAIWHEIVMNRLAYVEDAGQTLIAHVAEFEKPGNEVQGSPEREARWLMCGKCFSQASDYAAKEIIERNFGEDGESGGA